MYHWVGTEADTISIAIGSHVGGNLCMCDVYVYSYLSIHASIVKKQKLSEFVDLVGFIQQIYELGRIPPSK